MQLDELQAEILTTLRGVGPTSKADIQGDMAMRRRIALLEEYTDEQFDLAWSMLLHANRIQLTEGAFEWVPQGRIASELDRQTLLFG